MKILWDKLTNTFYNATNEPAAFLALFKRRAYSQDSLTPHTPESKAFFAAKSGDGSAARTFLTLVDDDSFKVMNAIDP